MMTRRGFLLGTVSAAALLGPAPPAMAAHAGKTVGAIRWDPWYETPGSSEIVGVNAALDPATWQGRAPSCATVTNSYSINLAGCQSQAQIDAEITAANGALIDYFAYCWYGSTHQMGNAWNFHQTSSVKNLVKWCFIFNSYSFFVSDTAALQSTYVGYLQQTNYQTVLSGRPLIYLLPDSSSVSALATRITAFRAACVAASLPTPYIVLLVAAAAGAVAAAGADAIGVYTLANGARPLAGAYASLVSQAEAYWATMIATGQQTVPTVVTGLDRRPRIERPVGSEAPGVTGQKPWIAHNQYFQAGTTGAIAAHVTDMLAWLTTNSASSLAQTGLIYSWNEHDEGGSTLNPSLGTASTILTAVGGVL